MKKETVNQEQSDYFIEPGQSFQIDLFRPEDAEGVARLFRTVYGEDYPIKKFMQPELLIEENAAGRTISSVARTAKGDIIGHNALFNSAPYAGIYESGAGLVSPSYRGTAGIFTKMIAHGQNIAAKRFGVELIYGEPVCNHLFSQKATAGLGWTTWAIEVDLMPAEAYHKEQSALGRVTALLDFITLKPKPHTVYLPAIYEETMRFLYSGMDDSRDMIPSEKDLPDSKKTAVKTQIFDFAHVARMTIPETGTDFERVFDQHEKKLLDKEMHVIQVWLNPSWPWIGRVVDVLRERGYFLGGILPRWFDEDGMLMQKIIGQPNWQGIQLYSDRAEKILNLVEADWQQVKKGR